MTWQRSISAAIKSLKREEKSLAKQLESVRSKVANLEQLGKSGPGVTRGTTTGRRRLSNKGREAISRAAKRRWAKYRTEQRAAHGRTKR